MKQGDKVMANNADLHAAGVAKKDEFYTQYEDIQSELNHYENHFRGKTVLCNCDDPFESNFCKFFLRNFNYLGLTRLICTSYSTSSVAWQQMTIWGLSWRTGYSRKLTRLCYGYRICTNGEWSWCIR